MIEFLTKLSENPRQIFVYGFLFAFIYGSFSAFFGACRKIQKEMEGEEKK